MREVVVRVPAAVVEDALDRLLPIVPEGVRERPRGRQVELMMRGDQLPSLREIQRSLGSLPHRLNEGEAPDDWRERRLADYEPNVIGARLLVRPEWAPPAEEPGVSEIVLEETSAFGAGTHPTTRTCVELLLKLEPRGSFADLGCGSGLLAIAAARMGWRPVTAVDVEPDSVETARANAAANAVEVSVETLDLVAEPAPAALGIAANVPPFVHAHVAASLSDPLPALAILSGFTPSDSAEVIRAYGARGLSLREQVEAGGWVVAVLERP